VKKPAFAGFFSPGICAEKLFVDYFYTPAICFLK
jgi:hypothetical protein